MNSRYRTKLWEAGGDTVMARLDIRFEAITRRLLDAKKLIDEGVQDLFVFFTQDFAAVVYLSDEIPDHLHPSCGFGKKCFLVRVHFILGLAAAKSFLFSGKTAGFATAA